MAAVDADGPLNVAVVGMSYWGPNLARNFDRLADSTLRWACDLDEELLDRHRAAFPLTRFTTNLDEVLADPETDAVVIATPVPTGKCQRIEPGKTVVPCAAYPTAIVTAGDGATYFDGVAFNPNQGTIYYKVPQHKVFDDILPSLNARWQLAPNWIARAGLSKTLGRQNYNLYGATYSGQSCGSQGCTVTGPNPNLKPQYARNWDFTTEYYFNPQGMISFGAFSKRITDYIQTDSSQFVPSGADNGFDWTRYTPYNIAPVTLGKASLADPKVFPKPVFPDFADRYRAMITESVPSTCCMS